MRTVFQLLFFIAAGALICTIVPQNLDPTEYHQRYGDFLANIIVRLQLDHVHSAGWFLLLLAILLLSLVACSGRLWQEAAVRWRLPDAAGASQRLKSPAQSSVASVAAPEAMAAIEATARRHGYSRFAIGNEGERQLVYLCKHRWSAWGQALAHYAVFAIAIGAVMGSLPGLSLDQQVNIQEGDTFHDEHVTVPFDIRVDKFHIAQDPATQTLQNYYSDVALVSNGQELARGQISVNHPLRYRGYFISQSSWGLGEARVIVTLGGKKTAFAFPLARTGAPDMSGEPAFGVPQESGAAFLPEGRAALVATGFLADAVQEGKEVVATGSEYPGRPALNLTFVSGLPAKGEHGAPHGDSAHGLTEVGWLFPGQSLPLAGGGTVKFVGITQTTGLGVRKDTGLPLVWLGFIACMIGLSLIFYLPIQRRVLACEPRGQGRTAISMSTYGRAHELTHEDIWSDLLQAVGGKPARTSATSSEEESSHD